MYIFFSLAEPQFIHENKPGDYESKSSCVTSAEETEGSTKCDWGCWEVQWFSTFSMCKVYCKIDVNSWIIIP